MNSLEDKIREIIKASPVPLSNQEIILEVRRSGLKLTKRDVNKLLHEKFAYMQRGKDKIWKET